MRLPRRKGPAEPVHAVRRTGQPDPSFNYELFNCNNFNIRYWSWNYRGCWPVYLSSGPGRGPILARTSSGKITAGTLACVKGEADRPTHGMKPQRLFPVPDTSQGKHTLLSLVWRQQICDSHQTCPPIVPRYTDFQRQRCRELDYTINDIPEGWGAVARLCVVSHPSLEKALGRSRRGNSSREKRRCRRGDSGDPLTKKSRDLNCTHSNCKTRMGSASY